MITITEAAEADIPRILEIEKASITPPWTENTLRSEVSRRDSYFALAQENGTIVGFCILRRISDEGELFQIAVDKASRGRGAGDALMTAALQCAGESELYRIYLEVRRSNTAAITLYNKYGFTAAGERKNYYEKPVEDALVMIRELVKP